MGLAEQWVVSLRWLVCQHVSTEGRQASFRQCLSNSLVVNQWSSTCIDKDGRRLHLSQGVMIHQMARAVSQRTVQRQDVGCGQEFF